MVLGGGKDMDRKLWQGAIILTMASMVIKVLSAVYRLPYQNLAGDVGLYVYQQIYPFYSLAVVMAGYGFPVVLSKLYAEYESESGTKNVNNITYSAFIFILIFSLLLFFLLFMGAPSIASFMRDPRLVGPLRIISFSFLFVPVVATIRGLFQGVMYNMSPTALSQVTEQTLRVSIILGLSVLLFIHHSTPYQFGKAAAFGSTVAPIGSSIVLVLFLIRFISKGKLSLSWAAPNFKIGKRIILEGLAFSICSIALVCIQFVDAVTLVPTMNASGYGLNIAKGMKGVFDRSYPLVQMGMTAAVSLSMAVVPLLSKTIKIKNETKLNYQLTFALRIGVIVGLAASIGLILIIKDTNIMLFKNSEGTGAIQWMTLCILFMSIVMISSTILQSIGYLWHPVLNVGIALVIKTVLNLFLIPRFSISGAAMASVAATGTICVLNIYKLKKHYTIRILPYNVLFKLASSLVVMAAVVLIWKDLCSYIPLLNHIKERWQATLIALSSVGLGSLSFLIMMLRLKIFSETELRQFPGGDKLLWIFSKNHL